MKNDEIKKAHPGAGTPGQATGQDTAAMQHQPPHEHFTASAAGAGGQGKIASLLGCGRAAAVTLQQLMDWTGLDGRNVRLAISRERLAGALILSDNRTGYFLASSSGEARRFARSMAHRAGEVMEVARLAEAAADAMEGQEVIEGWNI